MDSPEFADVDLILVLLIAQIARHQHQSGEDDADWVSMAVVESLCQTIGQLGAAAIERGWHNSASQRELLDVRDSPGAPKVRLSPSVVSSLGIDLLDPPKPQTTHRGLRGLVRRALSGR